MLLAASSNLDQLRQRVLTSYHLGPLSEDETRAYIEHRLHAVGWVDDPHWDDDAFSSVFAHTGGIPRRINRLCSRVLLYGVLEETHQITADVVDSTASELAHDLEGSQAEWASGDDAFTGSHVVGLGRVPDPQLTAMSSDLLNRVEALEQQMARREQVFRKLTQMLGVQ